MLRDRRVLRYIFGLLIAAVCIWYLAKQVSLDDLRTALASAEILPIIAAILVILITGPAKTWRWQLLYDPAKPKPPFLASYAALMVGQMVNIISPIARLGDVTRIFHLHQSSGVNRGETLGTMVSEKSFDSIFMLLTALILLPLITLPESIRGSLPSLAVVAIGLFVVLYLLAFRSQWVLMTFGRITQFFPARIQKRLDHMAASTLRGLTVLRNRNRLLLLLVSTAIITVLSIATPYILFAAFDLSLGLAEAMLLNFAVVLGLSLPGAPGRIGLFEGIVFTMLAYFGVADQSVQLGYAILYHLIVIVPPLFIGGMLAITSGYNWRESFRFMRADDDVEPKGSLGGMQSQAAIKTKVD